jgi:hypothetical protein
MMSLAGYHRRGWLALGFAGVILSGCGGGDSDGPPAVAAGGSVTFAGKPIKKGVIHFQPEKGRPASGVIKDGKFTLTTYTEDDGAVVGKHKVGLEVTEEVPGKDGDTTVNYLVPQKFADPGKSGVVVEIPSGGNTSLQIDVK